MGEPVDRVLLHLDSGERRVVDPAEVYYLEVLEEATQVRLRAAQPLIDTRPADEVLPRFELHGFLQIHREYAVNLRRIARSAGAKTAAIGRSSSSRRSTGCCRSVVRLSGGCGRLTVPREVIGKPSLCESGTTPAASSTSSFMTAAGRSQALRTWQGFKQPIAEYKLPSGRRIDILCRERWSNAFVAIELKKHDVHPVDQLRRYLRELDTKLAHRGKNRYAVKRIIVTGDRD